MQGHADGLDDRQLGADDGRLQLRTANVVTLTGDYGTGEAGRVGKSVSDLPERASATEHGRPARDGPSLDGATVDKFLIFTIVGLSTAAIYAVIASGLVLTYTTTGIFNFAHGAAGMLAAFLYWQLPVGWGWPAPVALVVVLLVLAPLFGVLLERVIMRGLEGTSEATKLVVSISLLRGHDRPRRSGSGRPSVARVVLPVLRRRQARPRRRPRSPTTRSSPSCVAIAVAIGLRLLLYRTRLGVAMRAVVDDRSLALLNGARTAIVVAQSSWAIGTSLAALGGILIASVGRAERHRALAAHRQRLRRRHLRSAALAAADLRRRHRPRAARRLPGRLPARQRHIARTCPACGWPRR